MAGWKRKEAAGTECRTNVRVLNQQTAGMVQCGKRNILLVGFLLVAVEAELKRNTEDIKVVSLMYAVKLTDY